MTDNDKRFNFKRAALEPRVGCRFIGLQLGCDECVIRFKRAYWTVRHGTHEVWLRVVDDTNVIHPTDLYATIIPCLDLHCSFGINSRGT